jgi:Protein of unknown function (DUF2630)
VDDAQIQEQISSMIESEKSLRERLAAGQISEAEEHAELARIEVALDQAWDLLRQRRARREFGENPDEASQRPANVVEGYLE